MVSESVVMNAVGTWTTRKDIVTVVINIRVWSLGVRPKRLLFFIIILIFSVTEFLTVSSVDPYLFLALV